MVSLAVGVTASMEHSQVRLITYSISRGRLADRLPWIPAVMRSVSPISTLWTPSRPLYVSCLLRRSHLQELRAIPELI